MNDKEMICYARGYFGFNFSELDRKKYATNRSDWFIIDGLKNISFQYEEISSNEEPIQTIEIPSVLITDNEETNKVSPLRISRKNIKGKKSRISPK